VAEKSSDLSAAEEKLGHLSKNTSKLDKKLKEARVEHNASMDSQF